MEVGGWAVQSLTSWSAVKPDAPSGQYVIEVGMYLPQSGQRLPVLDESGQVQGDRVLLETVETLE